MVHWQKARIWCRQLFKLLVRHRCWIGNTHSGRKCNCSLNISSKWRKVSGMPQLDLDLVCHGQIYRPHHHPRHVANSAEQFQGESHILEGTRVLRVLPHPLEPGEGLPSHPKHYIINGRAQFRTLLILKKSRYISPVRVGYYEPAGPRSISTPQKNLFSEDDEN